jgi:hypothetical protein
VQADTHGPANRTCSPLEAISLAWASKTTILPPPLAAIVSAVTGVDHKASAIIPATARAILFMWGCPLQRDGNAGVFQDDEQASDCDDDRKDDLPDLWEARVNPDDAANSGDDDGERGDVHVVVSLSSEELRAKGVAKEREE